MIEDVTTNRNARLCLSVFAHTKIPDKNINFWPNVWLSLRLCFPPKFYHIKSMRKLKNRDSYSPIRTEIPRNNIYPFCYNFGRCFRMITQAKVFEFHKTVLLKLITNSLFHFLFFDAIFANYTSFHLKLLPRIASPAQLLIFVHFSLPLSSELHWYSSFSIGVIISLLKFILTSLLIGHRWTCLWLYFLYVCYMYIILSVVLLICINIFRPIISLQIGKLSSCVEGYLLCILSHALFIIRLHNGILINHILHSNEIRFQTPKVHSTGKNLSYSIISFIASLNSVELYLLQSCAFSKIK